MLPVYIVADEHGNELAPPQPYKFSANWIARNYADSNPNMQVFVHELVPSGRVSVFQTLQGETKPIAVLENGVMVQ